MKRATIPHREGDKNIKSIQRDETRTSATSSTCASRTHYRSKCTYKKKTHIMYIIHRQSRGDWIRSESCADPETPSLFSSKLGVRRENTTKTIISNRRSQISGFRQHICSVIIISSFSLLSSSHRKVDVINKIVSLEAVSSLLCLI